jgi:HD-GYP domain-containing protein (c-di-GMP phosphodiesterase class II)
MELADDLKREPRAAGRDSGDYERLRSRLLDEAYAATVRALSNAISARDAYMGKRAERVAGYGELIGRAVDRDLVDDPQVVFGFLLHDIGKLAVPDNVLSKRGPLSPREWRLVRRHPQIGYEILRDIDFLDRARGVVLHHHERWDGRGYPGQIGGDSIPLEARVFAVADTLDAMTSERPYRERVGFGEAREEVERGSGAQFDPRVVAALAKVPDEEFERIRQAKG